MQFPDITTERLIIREYTDKYLNQVFEYRSDPRIYESYTKKQETPKDLQNYLKENITEFNKEDGYSVFVLLLDDKVIGEIALQYWDHQNEKNAIGYAIRPEYQRQGYAYEGVFAVLQYMFETMHRNKIQANVDYSNLASIALLRKLGFKEEGHLRQSEYKNGKWEDSYLFGMIRDDWIQRNDKERNQYQE